MNNETAIKTLIENWAAAIRHKDIEKVLAHHSIDMVIYSIIIGEL